ncbi:MAG: DUF4960 domain-containing protein [Bacteroidetes bacterium]|nr:DUF4960 domain-containing protein [Bacteroidota bacterium]
METTEGKKSWFRSELFLVGLILGMILIYLFGPFQNGGISIGILVTEEMNSDPEVQAAFQFLDRGDVYDPQKIFLNEIISGNTKLEDFDIIWFHYADSLGIPMAFNSPELIGFINEYVEAGGNLLLTQEAFTYLHTLGLETSIAQLEYANAVDDGYGRKLGYHAYIDHPLFKNLHGGAYVFNPFLDQKTRVRGYFGDEKLNGKVIGIDWSYITFNEKKKLILEYEKGKGKVLAIGAYALFNIQNHNWDEFGQLMNNTFFYLKGTEALQEFYWTKDRGIVESYDSEQKAFIYPKPNKLEIKSSDLQFNFDNKTNEFWDLTGERMMVMGHEKSGIDEIWAHPFMAIKDYRVGIKFPDKKDVIWLSDVNPKITITPASLVRKYNLGEFQLTELISVHHEKPQTLIHYEFEGDAKAEIFIGFNSNLRLMWPYSEKVIGGINYAWNDSVNAFIIKDMADNFNALVGMNRKPERQMIGKYDSILYKNEDFQFTETEKLQCGALAVFKADQSLDVVIAASHFADPNAIEYLKTGLESPASIYENSHNYYSNLLKNKLMITSPDTDLNIGYRWAIIGTDRHFTNTPGIGKSLVAGIGNTVRGWWGGHAVNGRPGYAWYFGRDSEWSSFAINAYGDYEKVKDVLKMLISYQHMNGKIFHELTTSGAVHYDAADATPLFVILAGKYMRASGDQDFIKKNWNAILKAINYCYSTDPDKDFLINNTNVGHGWVEGGFLFGGKTTLYLAACWAEALSEASYMTGIMGMKDENKKYTDEASKVTDLVQELFWNEKTSFYNHSLNTDGSFIEEKTVMPAIPMYFGQLKTEKTGNMLNEFASNNFTANWGSRIVGEDSKHFNPGGYHTGSVWPLYTGWVSLAEFKYGNHVQAYSHLMNNINVYKFWAKGFIEEVLHGTEYRPIGVCAHQCWSETMAVQPLIEGMLGLEVDANLNTLKLGPSVPANWDYYKIENINIGKNTLHYEMQRNENKVTYTFNYSGSDELKIYFEPMYLDGAIINECTFNDQPLSWPKENGMVELKLKKPSKLTITYDGGISVLPLIQNPQPGDNAAGTRIISATLKDNIYEILLEAPANSKANIQFYSDFKVTGIENASIVSKSNHTYEIAVNFANSTEKYDRIKVYLHLEDNQ